jgi:hypothetical protein
VSEPLLNERSLRDALTRVAERLGLSAKVGEILIHGGASMALVFKARPATRDVDAVTLSGNAAVTHAVHQVADELGLPRNWLNEQASSYLPPVPDAHPVVVFDHQNLRVMSVSAAYLFVMKIRAGRGGRDLDDAVLLAQVLGVGTPDDARRVHDRVFPDDPLPPDRSLRFADALAGQGPGNSQ